MSNAGDLRAELGVDVDERGFRSWTSATKKAEGEATRLERNGSAAFSRFASRADSSLSKLTSSLARLGKRVAFLSTTALAGLVGWSLKAGLSFNAFKESSQAAFATMLGGEKAASKFMDTIIKFATYTPFSARGMVDFSQKLMAFGFTAEEIIPSLTAIGDKVGQLGGSEDTINSVVRALGQMNIKGKLSAQEMMQLSESGINGWKYLAEAAGKTLPEIQKMAEKGLINSASAARVILDGMEKEAKGAMKKQANTWRGLVATVKDIWEQSLGTATEPLFVYLKSKLRDIAAYVQSPAFKSGLLAFRDAIENEIIPAIERAIQWLRANWPQIVQGFKDAAGATADLARFLRGVVGALTTVSDAFGGWKESAQFLLGGWLVLRIRGVATAIGLIPAAATAAATTTVGRFAAIRTAASLALGPIAAVVMALAAIPGNERGENAINQDGLGFLNKIPVLGDLVSQAVGFSEWAGNFGNNPTVKHSGAHTSPPGFAYDPSKSGGAIPMGPTTKKKPSKSNGGLAAGHDLFREPDKKKDKSSKAGSAYRVFAYDQAIQMARFRVADAEAMTPNNKRDDAAAKNNLLSLISKRIVALKGKLEGANAKQRQVILDALISTENEYSSLYSDLHQQTAKTAKTVNTVMAELRDARFSLIEQYGGNAKLTPKNARGRKNQVTVNQTFHGPNSPGRMSDYARRARLAAENN